jgi:hypothetical protein
MRKIVFAIVFIATSIAATAVAQSDVNVTQVNDRRSSGHFAQLVIRLELPKIKTGDVAASRVLVSSAVDDSGASLVDTEAGEPQLEQNYQSPDPDMGKNPVSVAVNLKNPARKVTKVKEVRGEVELYMPSKDANSIAEIPKFLSMSGKSLSHKALKANGVDIALVSPQQIAAEKKRLGDAKRKEYTASGWSGDDLESMVKTYTDDLFQTDEGDLLVKITDPNQRIQSINYVDATGDVKHVSRNDADGLTKFSTWGEKPQPDWKLQVSLKTSKNTQRVPFVVRDVALP